MPASFDQDVSSAAWWSTEARGGTEAEVLSLALLVVCGCDVDDTADRAVRQWCDGVIVDSPGYLDGAPWTSPRSWRGERRALVAQFKAWVKPPPPGISIELKRGIMYALALQFESILVAPPVGGLEKYLGALLTADEKKLLARRRRWPHDQEGCAAPLDVLDAACRAACA